MTFRLRFAVWISFFFFLTSAFQNCSEFRTSLSESVTGVIESTANSNSLTSRQPILAKLLASEALERDTWETSVAPVVTKGELGKWDSNSAYVPRIARNLDGTAYRDTQGYYYLYYTASRAGDGTDYDQTGLARSKDLKTWTKWSDGAPVLAREENNIDWGDISAVTVLHDGTKFHVWYEANATPPGDTSGDFVRIGYASSQDGLNWAKRGWVLEPGTSTYDQQDVYAPAVIKDGAIWKMWFTGHDQSGRLGIMYATSPAPEGPWTRVSAAFVFHPSDSTFASEVWKEGNSLFMTYHSGSDTWYAKMIDGIWIPQRIISKRATSGWSASDPGSWYTMAISADQIYLFFGANVYGSGGIGFRRYSRSQ